jgi:SulP family sulfate permease
LSDVASIRSGTPPHRHSSSGVNPGASTIESILDESSDNTQIPDQRDPGYPEAIEEVSEPTSPESHPSSRKSNSPSLLTEMIRNLPPAAQEAEQDDDFIGKPSAGPRPVSVHEGYIFQQPHEGTALLQKIASGKPYPHTSFRDVESLENRYRVRFHEAREAIIRWKDRGLRSGKVILSPKSWDKRTVFKNVVVKPASYVPAIMLGLLLNILDALSYGDAPD